MRFGSMPRDGGNLILSDEEKDELVAKEPSAEKWLRRYTGAREFLNGGMRWCLWLVEASPSELRAMPAVLKRIEATRQFRLNSKAASTRRFAETPAIFCQVAQPESDYLLLPRVSSERRPYMPIGFLSKNVVANDQVLTIEGATIFHFGILSSCMHMAWMRATCGRLKSDYRYSKDVVYNNFPWPTAPTEKQINKVEAAAWEVLKAREEHPSSKLAELYDPRTIPGRLLSAHHKLDRAVDDAYREDGGRRSWPSEPDRIAFLVELNGRVVETLQR
jgi:hypothetical protein